jgi:hypothetical protein
MIKIKYGDRGLLPDLRRAGGGIIVLAGATTILFGITSFGYTKVIETGMPDQPGGGVELGLAFSVLPGLVGLLMLFTKPAVWQGVVGLCIGFLTFLAQVGLLFLAVLGLVLGPAPRGGKIQLQFQPGLWWSFVGCAIIVLGGVVGIVQGILFLRKR